MHRLGRLHAFAEACGVNRYIAPAEEGLSFFSNHFFNDGLAEFAPFRVARQKDVTGGVMAGIGEFEAEFLAFFAQKLVRDLHEHAATIASFWVGTNGTAVVEVKKNL